MFITESVFFLLNLTLFYKFKYFTFTELNLLMATGTEIMFVMSGDEAFLSIRENRLYSISLSVRINEVRLYMDGLSYLREFRILS